MAAQIRAYLSPTLVLLAFNWEAGANRNDFLGFAIRRTPPYDGEQHPETINGRQWSWLPNRLSFAGPGADGQDFSSKSSPVQKFMWWDARYRAEEAGHAHVTYMVIPVTGQPNAVNLEIAEAASVELDLPAHVVGGV